MGLSITIFFMVTFLGIGGGQAELQYKQQILNQRKLLIDTQQQQGDDLFISIALKSVECNSVHTFKTPIWENLDQILDCNQCSNPYDLLDCQPNPVQVYQFTVNTLLIPKLQKLINTIKFNAKCLEDQFEEKGYGRVEIDIYQIDTNVLTIPDQKFDPQIYPLLETCEFKDLFASNLVDQTDENKNTENLAYFPEDEIDQNNNMNILDLQAPTPEDEIDENIYNTEIFNSMGIQAPGPEDETDENNRTEILDLNTPAPEYEAVKNNNTEISDLYGSFPEDEADENKHTGIVSPTPEYETDEKINKLILAPTPEDESDENQSTGVLSPVPEDEASKNNSTTKILVPFPEDQIDEIDGNVILEPFPQDEIDENVKNTENIDNTEILSPGFQDETNKNNNKTVIFTPTTEKETDENNSTEILHSYTPTPQNKSEENERTIILSPEAEAKKAKISFDCYVDCDDAQNSDGDSKVVQVQTWVAIIAGLILILVGVALVIAVFKRRREGYFKNTKQKSSIGRQAANLARAEQYGYVSKLPLKK